MTTVEGRDVRVVFQPIVDIRKKRVFAYEALVRPNNPFFRDPVHLFEEAAKHKVSGRLGRIIREMAIAQCPGYPLFLNIHPSELDSPFLVQPDDPVFRHDEDMYLEITEGVPLTHFALCKQILREVRGRGIYLVVDDLGAGYSNLKYIADLNPRVVKIDRELITGLTVGTRLYKLVKAIVAMCRDLDALVVAEGIETVTEFEAVREAGCDFAQGYLLARPAMPPPQPLWPRASKAIRRSDSIKPVQRTSNPPKKK
jgi:EAL domain-containing protein (putative c-di-GMP-specific phosphodiesterase class I)